MNTARWLKFVSYYRPYRHILLADLACALIVAVAALLLPLCARAITQAALPADSPDPLGVVGIIGAFMLLLIAVQTAANWFVDYRGHMMGALMERDLRAELFAHYQRLSFRFYDHQRTGALMSRLTHDSFNVGELFHHGPEDLAIALLKFAGAFIVLAHIHLPLTLAVFAVLPPMALYAVIFYRRTTRALDDSRARVSDINAEIEDALAGIRVVQAFTNERLEVEKFARANERFVASRGDGYRAEAFFSAGMLAFTQLLTLAVIVLGGAIVAAGGLNAPDLVTFVLCVAVLIDPVLRAVNIARLLGEGLTGFNRIMAMLEVAPEIVDAPDAVELTDVRGDLAFVNVGFGYTPDGPEVLRGLSLDIEAGEYVALVGASGVGKTTLCALIPRFYEVTEGAILLDGRDIRAFTLESLRRQIGVVGQDVTLFAGTVAENIAYGAPGASRAAILEAAEAAHAHEFITRLPSGYDTEIGQRGVRLSGGQKQRLSIARAFLKNPPILLLDEATSALDNESERAVQASLEALAQGRTVLVIAHRLSTIRRAGRILVLGDDGIVEAGTHDELLARDGAYAALYRQGAAVGDDAARVFAPDAG